MSIKRNLFTQLARIYPYLTLGFVVFILLFPKMSLIQVKAYATPIRAEDFLLAGLIFLGLLLIKINKPLRQTALSALNSPVSKLILSWIGVMYLSTTYNVAFGNIAPSSYFFVIRFIEYVVLFYLGYITASDFKFFKLCLKVFAALSLLISIWAALQFIGLAGGYGGGFYQYAYIKGTDRAFASFSGPYELAGFLIITIPVITCLLVFSRKAKERLYRSIVWLSSVLAMGFSGARFPVIAASLGSLSLISVKRGLKYRLIIVTLAILTIVTPIFVSETLAARLEFVTVIVQDLKSELGSKIHFPRLAFLGREVTTQSETGFTQELEQETTTVEQALPGVPEQSKVQDVPLEPLVPSRWQIIRKNTAVFFQTLKERWVKLIEQLKEKDPSLRWRLGETWPRAIKKVKENFWLGGGMGSIGIGLDGEFMTLLGETGVIGLTIFIILLARIVVEAWRKIQQTPSRRTRVFLFLAISATIGLSFNSIFADIFRASKIAMFYWYLIGITLGTQLQEKANTLTD